MTATQLSITGEESLCCTSYLTVLNILKATEDVDAKTRTLQDKVNVSSSNAFFSNSKRVHGCMVSRAHCNPLHVQWLHLQPERNLRAAMERTEG